MVLYLGEVEGDKAAVGAGKDSTSENFKQSSQELTSERGLLHSQSLSNLSFLVQVVLRSPHYGTPQLTAAAP